MTQYLMDRLEQGDLSLCCSCSLMCGPRRSLWACFLSGSPPALLASSSEGKMCLTNVRHCYHLRAAFCSTVLLTNSVLCVQYIFLSKLYKIKLTVAQPPLFNAQPPGLSIPKWCQRVSITVAFGTFFTTANISPLCITNDHTTPAWGIYPVLFWNWYSFFLLNLEWEMRVL